MNWKKITAYALALLSTQFALGFIEGAFAPASLGTALIGCFLSLILCGCLFAHLSFNQAFRPFTHAWAALALQLVMAAVLSQALTGWLGSTPIASVALEWLVLIFALLVGTAVGSFLRRSDRQPADA